MDAKTLVDRMKSPGGMSEDERIKLAADLRDILENHSGDNEGDVRHFLLLALGRVWQKASPNEAMNSPAAIESRRATMATLIKFADSPLVSNRKAAILAMVYWAGRDEVREALPLLISKVRDEREDIDVRLAAATVLGPLATPADKNVIDALEYGYRDTDPAHVELVWDCALSLAQLGQADVADTILKLLDRNELSKVQVLDRETDPKNPTYHTLSDAEQQRILINTMIGAAKLKVPAVQDKLKWIRDNDPSPRVRAAAMQVLGG
jgi:HEAT repeat protein